jgi:tetratricopeptide (TPR) repeat protein
MAPVSDAMRAHVEDGLKLCRAGDWNKGLPVLAAAIENRGVAEQVPGIAYSWLGYGVARFQGKHREGLQLCEHAIKLQYYEADNHWNLARVHVLASNRKQAVVALERALKLDPEHSGLNELKQEIGLRRPPVLKWLDRDHPLNKFLGRLRHNMKANAAGAPAARPGTVERTGTSTPRPRGATPTPPPPRRARPAGAGSSSPPPRSEPGRG